MRVALLDVNVLVALVGCGIRRGIPTVEARRRTDAYLLALAVKHRGTLVTFDRGSRSSVPQILLVFQVAIAGQQDFEASLFGLSEQRAVLHDLEEGQ